jgi:hypothetical protein
LFQLFDLRRIYCDLPPEVVSYSNLDLLTILQENRLRNEVQVKDHIINHKLIEKDVALVVLMTDVQELKKQKDA